MLQFRTALSTVQITNVKKFKKGSYSIDILAYGDWWTEHFKNAEALTAYLEMIGAPKRVIVAAIE